jgi:hypothetical protein
VARAGWRLNLMTMTPVWLPSRTQSLGISKLLSHSSCHLKLTIHCLGAARLRDLTTNSAEESRSEIEVHQNGYIAGSRCDSVQVATHGLPLWLALAFGLRCRTPKIGHKLNHKSNPLYASWKWGGLRVHHKGHITACCSASVRLDNEC